MYSNLSGCLGCAMEGGRLCSAAYCGSMITSPWPGSIPSHASLASVRLSDMNFVGTEAR